ncbi:MAG: hypothetical protein NTU95_10385 [Methanothrix sp.]|nr:hypothetical protein [Methanothrix sp.]
MKTNPERLWYKLADGRNGDKEIMIIMGEDGVARPLSNFSTIVKNMGEVKQIRIYVRPEDRMKGTIEKSSDKVKAGYIQPKIF